MSLATPNQNPVKLIFIIIHLRIYIEVHIHLLVRVYVCVRVYIVTRKCHKDSIMYLLV